MPHAYLSKATEARSAVVAGQTEGHMASQAHDAPLLYVHPHPTAARRAATLASSEREMHMGARTSSDRFRGVLRHEKSPLGYTSTPAGLKRLKTQNTAFHGNANRKGTPSGVPQPIHKRKLVLVKEEFDASSSGGGGGNRTPVQKPSHIRCLQFILLNQFKYVTINKQSFAYRFLIDFHEYSQNILYPLSYRLCYRL